MHALRIPIALDPDLSFSSWRQACTERVHFARTTTHMNGHKVVVELCSSTCSYLHVFSLFNRRYLQISRNERAHSQGVVATARRSTVWRKKKNCIPLLCPRFFFSYTQFPSSPSSVSTSCRFRRSDCFAVLPAHYTSASRTTMRRSSFTRPRRTVLSLHWIAACLGSKKQRQSRVSQEHEQSIALLSSSAYAADTSIRTKILFSFPA